MFHKYFVVDNESGALECGICHEEVNKEYGSYYCPECKFIFHVNCALQFFNWYYKIESKDDYEKALAADTMDPPFLVVRDGENMISTEIKHFFHQHNLVLTEVEKDDDSGFAYKCVEYLCGNLHCVRCVESSLVCTSRGHKHCLLYYYKYDPKDCNVCGHSTGDFAIYRCKGCDFNVHANCTYLPQTARHKCDEHLLTLKYHEDNDYPKSHCCDICEEKRNPNIWFYHCAICDTSAHTRCVLGDYPFVKPGIRLFSREHPHPLVLVKRGYDYPECCKLCGKSCLDLAVECTEAKCNYVTHFKKCVE
ncbi:hypothetical protein PTKIN_Ptkin16aG0502100 [Pterospermum kingtungense]